MKIKNNLFKVLFVLLVIIEITSIYLSYKSFNNKEVELDEVILKEEKESKSSSFAIMLQNDNGEYAESNSNAYPTEAQGYRFNTSKSGCINNKGELVENALSFNNGVLNISVGESVQCYTYFDKLYTVSYDTDGGEFENTPPTKQVVYGDTYGELPEPTKTGYTFKGWNGKNMLDIDYFVDMISPYQSQQATKLTIDGIDVWKVYGEINQIGRKVKWFEGKFKSNIRYRFIVNYQNHYINSNVGILMVIHYTDDSEYWALLSGNDNEWTSTSYLTKEDKSVSYISLTYGNYSAYTYFKDLQIIEESESQLYEPYYIESDTKVVQRQNHTLKAIWEANS